MTSWQWDVALGLTVFGAIVALTALRCRTFTDPRCRACDRDLRDATDQLKACPGCGSDLTARRAVRFRHRGVARDRGGFGAVILLLGGAAIGGVIATTPAPRPPTPPGAFAAIPTDQLAAEVGLQGLNPRFWHAVAERVSTESWTASETEAVIQALITELQAQRAMLDAADLPDDSVDTRGTSRAVVPFFSALATKGERPSEATSRALYHALYGPAIALQPMDRRLTPRAGRFSVGFSSNPFTVDSIPTAALIWIDDVRVDGASILDHPHHAHLTRHAVDQCAFMLMDTPAEAELECDVAYALVPRTAPPGHRFQSPGPPSNWPVSDDAISRTTLRYTIAPPPPVELTMVDDPARDDAVRARITVAPLQLHERDGAPRAFTSITMQPDAELGLHFTVTARIGAHVVALGDHGLYRPENPQPPSAATRRIDVELPMTPAPDTTTATITLTPKPVSPRQLRGTISLWGRPITFDVPIERSAPSAAHDGAEPASPTVDGAHR